MSKEGYGILTAFHACTVFVIILLNGLLFCTLLVNQNLRTASNMLFANIWLANLILGIVTAVANVASGQMSERKLPLQSTILTFSSSEWTATVVNCFVTISVLLSLTINRLLTLRSTKGHSSNGMSFSTVFKIGLSIWVSVLLLSITDTIVSSLHETSPDTVCYVCLFGFELTCLLAFSFCTVISYLFSLYLITVRKNRTVYDSVRQRHPAFGHFSAADRLNLNREYRLTSTIGLMLTNFAVACATYIVFEAMFSIADKHYYMSTNLVPVLNTQQPIISRHPLLWEKNNADRRRRALDVSNGLTVGLLYAHCLLNPVVFLCRDDETCASVRNFLACWRQHPEVEINENNNVVVAEEHQAFIRPAAIERENSHLSSVVQYDF